MQDDLRHHKQDAFFLDLPWWAYFIPVIACLAVDLYERLH